MGLILSHTLNWRLKDWAEREGIVVDTYLHNVEVNWCKVGCRGHIVNRTSGSWAYVNTEVSFDGKVLYRLARDGGDYSSTGLINGHNRWCDNDADELAWKIIRMLIKEKASIKENG